MGVAIVELASAQGHHVAEQEFRPDNQKKLLEYALAFCAKQMVAVVERPRQAGGAASIPSEHSVRSPSAVIGIGTGAIGLVDNLRQQAIGRLRNHSSVQRDRGRFHWPGRHSVLVLVVPHLPADYFSQNQGPYSDGALIHQLFDRIVVLHCSLDRRLTAGFDLGRVGPSGTPLERVQAIDITPLLECWEDGVYGALCSCECTQMIAQLLLGVELSAALPRALRK